MASPCSAPPTPVPCDDRARPRAGSRRSTSTSVYLSRRSAGMFSKDAGMLFRKNLKVFRQIILQDSRVFKKVWTRHSKSPISYESGRIYFENYRCCFSSIPSRPQHLYQLPKSSKLEKIEDVLLCQSPLVILPRTSDQAPSLLALTAHNWLYRLSTKTGEQLQKVCLSSRYKFRYLGWDVPQETFYIKSVQNKQSPTVRQAGLDNNAMIYLAVFQVFPLEIVAVLEISKRVFGSTVLDVTLSQGVLVVSHSNKTVKLYSFENIVDKFMTRRLVLGEQCQWSGISGTVGESPFGIPVNIHINECPPVLYELPCLDNYMQIGGHPWHVIFTPNHKKHRGTYHICLLKDGTLNSVTSSGRMVRRRFHQLDDDPEKETFRVVEYEDELDLLAVVEVTLRDEKGRANVGLHDNQSGVLMKTVELVESWDVTYTHELFFDQDTIVHIAQEKNNLFSCHVYKSTNERMD
uniref:Ddb1 and cul4 associated factor 17 n=1 Tax=Scleropages formosus TaxID=113540 RepID=A0A8C9WRT6_SCLFO